MNYLNYLDSHKDFPTPGVNFYCIARLLREVYPEVIRDLALQCRTLFSPKEKVLFAGIESRGFLLAAGLAAAMGKGLIMVRKAGKLPGIGVVSTDITLEYGTASIETHYGRGRVILCDDVVATGGTLLGAETLLTKAGYDVTGKLCLLNLKHLNQLPDDTLISLLKVWS